LRYDAIDERIKTIYLGGYSRSGSTLVDRMLGEIPGFVSTGELGYITTHGLEQNRLCGCRSRFRDCAFWQRVGREAFGSWDSHEVNELESLYRAVCRHRFIPLLLAPGLSRRFEARLDRYAQLLGRLYAATAKVAEARVVVDSTIDPSYAFVLRRVPTLDVRWIHLVRDSRATAFSWTKRVLMEDAVDDRVYLGSYPPALTAIRWNVYHLLFHAKSRLGDRQLLMRYEDIMENPTRHLAEMLEFVGEPVDPGALAFAENGTVHLHANHTPVGNRMRFVTGQLPLAVDDEWRGALTRRQRSVVTVLTAPLLRRYGYVGRSQPLLT
jgi:hypothetical protein